MREINVSKIEETVRELCIKANLLLPSDMEEFKVNITGKLNNEYVLNPLFTWDNSNNDSSFTYELSKNGEVVFSKTTTSTSFQPGDLLSANSNYQFKVATTNVADGSVVVNDSNVSGYVNQPYIEITFETNDSAKPFT